MKRALHVHLYLLLFVATTALGSAQTASSSTAPIADAKALESFAAIHPIDVHVHIFKTDPAFQAMLERLNLKVLDILVMDDTNDSRKQLSGQVSDALALVRSSRGHIALCTTFDPYRVASPSFAADAIKQLDRDFAEGAIAVKIWKNIGMEMKNSDGSYVLADDPRFEPIYQDIQRRGKTLMSHQAEPDVAWGPPDPADPSWSYYQENPQWYVANKPGFPSKKAILDARDRILAQNPNLRMVGVHLGSMERDLDNIARHFDQYPNFAIDMAARMEYLIMAPPDKVRAFLIKYQDRVLYGTDLDVNPDAKIPEVLEEWQSRYARDWKYLATDAKFKEEGRQGREVQGLNLPPEVLTKIFHTNAQHWIPGL
jgi:predicted TIM-barrel fold metal-dependent hydrolase